MHLAGKEEQGHKTTNILEVAKMGEKDWILSFIDKLQESLQSRDNTLRVESAKKVIYAQEILRYDNSGKNEPSYNKMTYETDILISQVNPDSATWVPRVIIEGKIRINTHDAITYSRKAETHKNVHPYLRYGILIGYRKHYPLPGRLFRHGTHFDFMISWKDYEASQSEWAETVRILEEEVAASRKLEEIIFNSRSKHRESFTYLHKPLLLK